MIETVATATILSIAMILMHKVMLSWMSSEMEKPYNQLNSPTPPVVKDHQ